MDTESLTKRIDELVLLGNESMNAIRNRSGRTEWLEHAPYYKFKTAAISFINNLYGEDHAYSTEFIAQTDSERSTAAHAAIGILNAIRNEIEAGWLDSATGLISAEIFGDFLEMAEHLLEEGYKDPAAVIIGSALEQHLRLLAQLNGIETIFERNGESRNKKADLLNSDLTKAKVYTKIDQKSVTSWLGIRNEAAHGNFENYSKEQVDFMLASVSEFIGRVSA